MENNSYKLSGFNCGHCVNSVKTALEKMYGSLAVIYDRIFPYNPSVVAMLSGYIQGEHSRALDVGCGTGKYTHGLSEKCYATGLDPDAASITRACELYPGSVFQNSDLAAFKTDKKFDLIFCIGNSISHVSGEERHEFIAKIYALLNKGGVWVFHTLNWDKILEMKEYEFPVIQKENLTFKRWYKNISNESVDFLTNLTDENGNEYKNKVKLYPFTDSNIQSLHKEFEQINLFSDYNKTPFKSGDMSRVYVFRKV